MHGCIIKLSFFFQRNSFNGKLSAYGAGNDVTLEAVKAGPGTIFLKEGKQFHLRVHGDTDSSVQQQTSTYISGEDDEFAYDQLTLDGNIIYLRNEFNFLNVHGIMNTSGRLQESRSIH